MFLCDPVRGPPLFFFWEITDSSTCTDDSWWGQIDWHSWRSAREEGFYLSSAALDAMWQRNMTAGLYKYVSNKHNRSGAVRACYWTEQTCEIFCTFSFSKAEKKISDLNCLNLVFMGSNNVLFFLELASFSCRNNSVASTRCFCIALQVAQLSEVRFANMVCTCTAMFWSSHIIFDASPHTRKLASHRENKFEGDAGVWNFATSRCCGAVHELNNWQFWSLTWCKIVFFSSADKDCCPFVRRTALLIFEVDSKWFWVMFYLFPKCILLVSLFIQACSQWKCVTWCKTTCSNSQRPLLP